MPQRLITVILLLSTLTVCAAQQSPPLRIGIVGLTHTHVHWILGREHIGDIEIVGISESNRDLARRYCIQHGIDTALVYPSMAEMIEATHPEAVTAFNSTYEHVEVVRYCAPRGIHVMVEKPLAARMDHLEEMLEMARKHHIHLLTNYETSWYATTAEAGRLINEEKAIGEIRRIIFYTGHQGPIEIGCNAEFLEWLTDPALNGGGALMDFGCYGANIATWLMQGEKPLSIQCDTQHIKPGMYPNVEDDATIILNYPHAQVIIIASWNWPYNRKEMEVYGTDGYVFCRNREDMIVKRNDQDVAQTLRLTPKPGVPHDPFAYLAAVVQEAYPVDKWDVSALENNRIVVEILTTAMEAAK